MNERIKQLMEQTLDEKFAGTWSVMDLEDLTKFADRFAELVVRECVICAEREWIRNGSDTEHNQAVSKVIESIKQHFGVEE